MNRGGSEEREGRRERKEHRNSPGGTWQKIQSPTWSSGWYVLGRGCGRGEGAGGGRQKVALPSVCSQALAETFPGAACCPGCHTKYLVLLEVPGPPGVKPLNRPWNITQHEGMNVAVRTHVTGVQLPHCPLPTAISRSLECSAVPGPGSKPHHSTSSCGELGWLLEGSR